MGEKMGYCNHCKKALPDGHQWCPYCMQRIQPAKPFKNTPLKSNIIRARAIQIIPYSLTAIAAIGLVSALIGRAMLSPPLCHCGKHSAFRRFAAFRVGNCQRPHQDVWNGAHSDGSPCCGTPVRRIRRFIGRPYPSRSGHQFFHTGIDKLPSSTIPEPSVSNKKTFGNGELYRDRSPPFYYASLWRNLFLLSGFISFQYYNCDYVHRAWIWHIFNRLRIQKQL